MEKYPKPKKSKNIWQVQEAKAKFSYVVECAQHYGQQQVTKNGKAIAVILSIEEFDRLTKPETSLLDFFKSAPCQDVELKITRSRDLPRDFDL